MATNLDIDPRLLEEAINVGKKKTKKAAVTEALQEYIRRRRQQEVLSLFGTVDYDDDYNYKLQRSKP
jgi:Arc/MetJ family transcription regulator